MGISGSMSEPIGPLAADGWARPNRDCTAGRNVTPVTDLPPTPPPPSAARRRRPLGRRIVRAGVVVTAVAIVLVLAFEALDFSLGWTTWRAVIPPSCQEPSSIDYSKVGRPDYGPYSVKFTSWHSAPWGESSGAMVGHGQTVESRSDYGVYLRLESTGIDRFQCRWTNTGVTIVEPVRLGRTLGLEHFVPAEEFLGGR